MLDVQELIKAQNWFKGRRIPRRPAQGIISHVAMVPDDARERVAVYVIGPENGPYKIGFSVEPEERRLQLEGRPHSGLRVWGAKYVLDWVGVEGQAHRMLERRALGNEWFDCTLAEAVRAVESAIEWSEAS